MKMLNEFRFAEACVFLFHLNKWHPSEWSYVVNQVLLNVPTNKFSMAATIVQCSSRSDLSSCNVLIPGLSEYTHLPTNPDFYE